jgi:trehalose/maltose hydrolase-like predicted phosphorylase
MRDYGAEIVLDTAVFWGSRAEWKNGRYELREQIGPDEFHENINNPVYTNRLAMWNLEQALKVLEWLRSHAPEKARSLVQQLDLTDERLSHWHDVIAHLVIGRYEPLDIYQQFDGFFDLEPVDVPSYEPRVINMDVILGHARTQKTRVLKQADVVMLIGLLKEELGTEEELIRNWRAYVPMTAHDSSLSPGMHAWVGAYLGLTDEAYGYWIKAAGLDLENNKGNVRDGIHAAAAGTLWQAVVFGFAGLHLDADGNWQTRPQLPRWWKSVSFTFYHHGKRLRLRVQ